MSGMGHVERLTGDRKTRRVQRREMKHKKVHPVIDWSSQVTYIVQCPTHKKKSYWTKHIRSMSGEHD